jgi:hypothetical protein
VESFTTDPWPTWVFRLEGGTRIEQQLFSVNGAPGVVLTWSVVDGSATGVRLMIRPLLPGRDAGSLHHENPHFRFEAMSCDSAVRWHPYSTLPGILAGSNGSYAHHPLWYRHFLYEEDRARGRDHAEDLASPGVFHFDLSRSEVRAPMDGTVANADRLQIGQMAVQGLGMLSLVHNQQGWGEAHFKETDVRMMVPGQRAKIEIDAYPDEEFAGHIQSVGAGTGSEFAILPAQNANGRSLCKASGGWV